MPPESEDVVWSYRDARWHTGDDLIGYDVWAATDGSIGKVDQASNEVDGAYLVVDTGPWIFGSKRLIPAGVVNGIIHDKKQVHIMLSKDQVKDAPDYDSDNWDDELRRKHTEYYSSHGAS